MSNKYQKQVNKLARWGTKIFWPTTFGRERKNVRQAIKDDKRWRRKKDETK
jgi:hypothetical protein